MTLLLTLAAAAVALLVTLVTCIQLLYLESLRVRTRELPALQFFREAIEPRIGLSTERGGLTFSLVKHIGLGILGCLIVAITVNSSPLWEALAGAFLLTGLSEAMTELLHVLGIDVPGAKQVFYGVCLLVVVLALPDGIWPWLARRLGLERS